MCTIHCQTNIHPFFKTRNHSLQHIRSDAVDSAFDSCLQVTQWAGHDVSINHVFEVAELPKVIWGKIWRSRWPARIFADHSGPEDRMEKLHDGVGSVRRRVVLLKPHLINPHRLLVKLEGSHHGWCCDRRFDQCSVCERRDQQVVSLRQTTQTVNRSECKDLGTDAWGFSAHQMR